MARLLAQGVGVAGQTLRVFAPLLHNRDHLLLLDCAGNAITSVHYFMLGGIGGCYAAIFRAVMCLAGALRERYAAMRSIYGVLYLVVAWQLFHTYTVRAPGNFMELVPQCSSFFSLLARQQSDVHKLRLWLLGTFPWRWTYAYVKGSWPVLISDVLCFVNVVGALWRFHRSSSSSSSSSCQGRDKEGAYAAARRISISEKKAH